MLETLRRQTERELNNGTTNASTLDSSCLRVPVADRFQLLTARCAESCDIPPLTSANTSHLTVRPGHQKPTVRREARFVPDSSRFLTVLASHSPNRTAQIIQISVAAAARWRDTFVADQGSAM